ncbi:hypothetical protein CBOM_07455 [Ceraceosorus bombacis]|uniref:Uncharacterized protein n=1 Tax=Ceraceosorus bombacis TaxID=401625 RepID=A0A0N7L9F4_9BASI|nr:hypothetical protein CBOM_07455 [Ceraceosorus bombacis]
MSRRSSPRACAVSARGDSDDGQARRSHFGRRTKATTAFRKSLCAQSLTSNRSQRERQIARPTAWPFASIERHRPTDEKGVTNSNRLCRQPDRLCTLLGIIVQMSCKLYRCDSHLRQPHRLSYGVKPTDVRPAGSTPVLAAPKQRNVNVWL